MLAEQTVGKFVAFETKLLDIGGSLLTSLLIDSVLESLT